MLLAPANTASHPTFSLNAEGKAASPNPQIRTVQLEFKRPLERKLTGGETHIYEISLAADQFVRLLVDQRGADVAFTVFSPDGAKLREVDDLPGERGSERASLITQRAGIHRVEVQGVRKTAPPGSYQITLDGLQAADEQARSIDAAEQFLAEGNALRDQSAKESPAHAIVKYWQALVRADAAGDLQMKAAILNRLGRSHFALGEYQKALDYHQQALPLSRVAADHQAEAATLTYIGDAYRVMPEKEKAVEYLTQAIQGWQSLQDRRGEVGALNLLARVYFQMGDQYKSISTFDRALHLARILADQSDEAFTLAGMGLSYYALGENEKAAEIWKQELVLVRAGFRPGYEASLLGKLGSAYNELGQPQEALNYLKQAIKLARDSGDRVDEAGTLQTMGRVYRAMGEPRKSIEYLEQSLVLLKELNNPPTNVARAHYNLGKVYTDLGEYEKALSYLNEALLVWRARRDPINIASTIREMARAESGRGNLETALTQSEVAVNLIEWLRAQAGGPDARANYLASVQDYFELKVEVLTRLHKLNPSKGHAAAALQTSERARARSLLETLAEAGVDIRRGVDRDLLKREQTITEELSAKASEQARLAGTKATRESLEAISREIKELSSQHEKIEAQIRAASPRYAELIQPRPLSLAEIREQVIDNQSLLLEYYLGENRSYLWAVTSTSIEIFELPKRSVIEAAARPVYELLTARNRRLKFETVEERRGRIERADADYLTAARALSRMVLDPVRDHLTNKRLLVVSDGALQYIPFAALPAPGSPSYQPLAAGNEVVSLPSASTLAVLRREVAKHKPAPKTIAVLADPVFSEEDERVRESLARNRISPTNMTIAGRRPAAGSRTQVQQAASDSGWDGEALNMARVPFTRLEAEAIAGLIPAALRTQKLDFAANLSNATSAELSQYRILHFATHGFLNSRHPELSGIVFSLVDEKGQEQNGFLRAHEIYELTLPAELVVLSGCRTGLGKDIRGEGLIGLTRAFMHDGAARVLVSLWDVSDEATAELITRFYARLLGPDKVSPAAALRAAQDSMAREKRWAAPYFWAGFTLQGEPR